MPFMSSIKRKNLLPIITSITILIILSFFFDFYFDLNDDVMINDLISGSYTGMPEITNIQILLPLSFILSSLYKLNMEIPWYGLFLLICNFTSICLIIRQIYKVVKSKYLLPLVSFLFVICFVMYQYVFIQYTVTSGFLICAAGFRFLCASDSQTALEFIRNNLINILLYLTAFCLRS